MALVALSSSLLTAYTHDGRTRYPGGVLPPDEDLKTAEHLFASTSTADALVKLDAELVLYGAARLRIVDPYRPPERQAAARERYERWVAAGRPIPGRAGYDPNTMSTAFARKPGESGHSWGGSVDFDQDAMEFPGTGRGTDYALAAFWRAARPHGFTPILATPSVHQSEAWHFDHLGVLTPILDLAKANDSEQGNLLASMVGTALSGTFHWTDGRIRERYVQARLTAGGYWVGMLDGMLGTMTKAALKAAKCPAALARSCDLDALIAWLNESKIGDLEPQL